MIFRDYLLPAICFLLLSTTALNGQHYFQQQTNYKINATLDTTEKTLDLIIDLAYINNSPNWV